MQATTTDPERIAFPKLGTGHEWYWGGRLGCWLNTEDGRVVGPDGALYSSLWAFGPDGGLDVTDGPDFVAELLNGSDPDYRTHVA